MSGLRYIPRHKRRQQADRLHGAFAGGFSAGYFNTVGSREGWQPRQTTTLAPDEDDNDASMPKRQQQQQEVEDFMDEQDHNEWGGPRRVRQDLAAGDIDNSRSNNHDEDHSGEGVLAAAAAARKNQEFLDAALSSSTNAVMPPQNVGQRLLHQLGWRGGNSSNVYMPLPNPSPGQQRQHASTTAELDSNSTTINNRKDDEQSFLSERRLRKIQIQQRRIQIPPPKLDSVGLGFEAHENAPEFRQYFERRQKQQRLRAQGGLHNKNRNVYRLSDIMGSDHDEQSSNVVNAARPGAAAAAKETDVVDASYHDYETVEDFIGAKSVGGFALREDDDDAFDDEHLTRISNKIRIDEDQYDTVIQDDPDDHSAVGVVEEEMENDDKAKPASILEKESNPKAQERKTLGNALSAWARYGTTSNTQSKHDETGQEAHSERLTFDGRPVLPGFVPAVGGGEASILNQRFRGPDLPENYTTTSHVFAPNDRPLILQTLARASQLELEDARRQQAIDQALEGARVKAAALSQSKRSPSSDLGTRRKEPPTAVSMVATKFEGLAQSMMDRFAPASSNAIATQDTTPPLTTNNATSRAEPPSQSKSATKMSVTRTIQTFRPSALLCKRFRVPVPKHQLGKGAATLQTGDTRRQEERFFEDTVLKAVETARAKNPSNLQTATGNGIAKTEESNPDGDPKPERPPMAVYRSIFASTAATDDGSVSSEQEMLRNTTREAQVERAVDVGVKDEESGPVVLGDSRDTESKRASTMEPNLNQQPDTTDAPPNESVENDRHTRHHEGLSDSAESDSSEERRRERKRKKRKRKEKKSRRRSDDDGDDDSKGRRRRHRRRHHHVEHKRSRKMSS